MSKSEQTRERIMAAAGAIFHQRGFANTRLADVAERVGIQPGSLYYHFDSKEDLIFALVERGIGRIFTEVQEQVGQVPRRHALRRLEVAIETHLRVALEADEYSGATVRMYGQIPAEINHLLRPQYDDITTFWRDLVAAAQRQGSITDSIAPEVASLLMLGALNWTTAWYRPDVHTTAQVVSDAKRLLLGEILQPTPDMQRTDSPYTSENS